MDTNVFSIFNLVYIYLFSNILYLTSSNARLRPGTIHAKCFSFPLHSAAVDTHVCHRANTTRKWRRDRSSLLIGRDYSINDRQTDKLTDRQTYRQTNRQTDRQTDRQTPLLYIYRERYANARERLLPSTHMSVTRRSTRRRSRIVAKRGGPVEIASPRRTVASDFVSTACDGPKRDFGGLK